MRLLLPFWWAVLMLINNSFTLKTSDPVHKDGTPQDAVDLLSSFYLAVEKALPELQELRSSFESLREQYNHFHTLDDMLANFGQLQDEDSKEDTDEEEMQVWQESTKAWIRDIEANFAKNGVNLNISELEQEVNSGKKDKSKEHAKKFKVINEDINLEKSATKKNSLREPESSVIKEKVKLKSNHDLKPLAAATNNNPKDTEKLLINPVMVPSEHVRPKRSLKENQEVLSEQHVMVKRKAHMLDDFEDHNGNRASFGVLGNGLLTPDAEGQGGNSMSFPTHEMLSHYNNLEDSHDYEILENIYDPTENLVPLFIQQQQVQHQQLDQQQQQEQQQQQKRQQQQQQPQHQQPQQQQPQQQQPPGRPSHFKASFNLANIFKDLQKPQQPATPVSVQQPNLQYRQPVPQSPNIGVHRNFGPLPNKQQKLNMDPNCVPVTVLPPNCSTFNPEPVISSTTPSPAPSTEIGDACNSADAVRMSVAINANVCGDPKTKLFSGNGSISVQPAPKKLHSDTIYQSQNARLCDGQAGLDERHIRDAADVFSEGIPSQEWELENEEKKPRWLNAHVKAPSFKVSGKKKNTTTTTTTTKQPSTKAPTKSAEKDHKNSTKCNQTQPEESEARPSSFDKLISGKLSEDIVDAVFEAIGCDPEMERLVPVLQRNRQKSKQPKDFYQIRDNKTENFLRQTEGMVRDTMHAISEIIEQQVGRRACIPLRPDLVEFYELILKTAEEEQKVREKRQSSLRVLSADFSEDVRLLDPEKISEKTRTVKKLLQQYEDLPLGDQLAAAKTHDELLLDFEFLRKMADTVEHRKRSARLQDVVKQQTLDEALEQHVDREYSPRFIKLLKTAELFKESGETLAKDRV